MDSAAITSEKIEQVQIAIQQLTESKQASPTKTPFTDNDEEGQLLSKLLSQLESLKDGVINPSESSAEPKKVPSGGASEVEAKSKNETKISESNTGVGAEDVVKELKKLERQNRTTHWLLSALIVLTVAWQLSEVSLLLKLKEGLSHPFKSFGNMLAGMVKRPRLSEEEADKNSLLTKVNGNDNHLKLPEMDLSGLIMNGEEE